MSSLLFASLYLNLHLLLRISFKSIIFLSNLPNLLILSFSCLRKLFVPFFLNLHPLSSVSFWAFKFLFCCFSISASIYCFSIISLYSSLFFMYASIAFPCLCLSNGDLSRIWAITRTGGNPSGPDRSRKSLFSKGRLWRLLLSWPDALPQPASYYSIVSTLGSPWRLRIESAVFIFRLPRMKTFWNRQMIRYSTTSAQT